jgi:hypothetical protein
MVNCWLVRLSSSDNFFSKILVPVLHLNKTWKPVMGLIFYENKIKFWLRKIKPNFNLVLTNHNWNWQFLPTKVSTHPTFVGTCIGLVYNIVPSINTDIKTLPNSYDLRQYRPYTSTNLVGTWGNITVIFALYQFQ